MAKNLHGALKIVMLANAYGFAPGVAVASQYLSCTFAQRCRDAEVYSQSGLRLSLADSTPVVQSTASDGTLSMLTILDRGVRRFGEHKKFGAANGTPAAVSYHGIRR